MGEDAATEVVADRTKDALEESMSVLPDQQEVKDADDMVMVVSESEYIVYLVEPACECEDFRYRDHVDRCKHIRRAQFATDHHPIPPHAFEACDIDETLGQHTCATPHVLVDIETVQPLSAVIG